MEFSPEDDILLTQAAHEIEESLHDVDFLELDDLVLTQIADRMEKDYSLSQLMQDYLPPFPDEDFDIPSSFDLGYYLDSDNESVKDEDLRESKPTENSRFAEAISDSDIKKFVDGQKNENTERNTKWGLGVFNAWRVNRDSNIPDITKMDAETMNMWLSRFIMEARKKDGTEYPPKSLYLISCGLLRHLRDHDIDLNFLSEKDFRFSGFRRVLDAKMKELLSRGIGTETKKAEPILHEDEAKLWETDVFGDTSSESLQHTAFYYCCKLFGLRGFDEHRALTCEQFEVGRDSSRPGGRYIHFHGRASKTVKGGLGQREIEVKDIKHLCVDGQGCIADYFEKYLSALGNKGYFYRKPLAPLKDNEIRYGEQPVGINKIKTFTSVICKKGGLEGRFSNHSGKRSCATHLFHAGVDEQEIMARTGHRSEKGVRKYKTPTASVVQATSAALDPPQPKSIKLEEENAENSESPPGHVPSSVMEKAKPATNVLSDVTNKLGCNSGSGVVFTNCTFNF